MTNRRAFTLVELLVVIGIIGVLAGLLLPNLFSSQAEVRKAQCVSNQKQIYDALLRYAHDHRDNLPWAGNNKAPWEHLQILVDQGYIKEPRVFVCPASPSENPAVKDANKKFKLTSGTCSYTVYKKPVNFNNAESDQIILGDRDIGYHPNGYCCISLDYSGRFERAPAISKDLADCSTISSKGGETPAEDPGEEPED